MLERTVASPEFKVGSKGNNTLRPQYIWENVTVDFDSTTIALEF